MKFTNTKVQMMQNVHLAPETDEDDLYSGYNDYNPIYDIEELENDAAFQQAVRTSHGRRPPITAKISSTAVTRPIATGYGSKTSLASSIGRPMTGAIQDGVTRPMTAVRAAGFTKAALRGSAFDPLSQSRGPASPLEAKKKDSPEEKIKQLEKEVNELVEESCIANSCGDLKLALEKAKDAGRKERVLVRQREQVTTPENINLDLTYSVLFNLASQYSVNEMYAEALNTYQVIVKNKMFSNAGILKMNMGNIYLKQRNYSKAIKFYRMALDQVPSVNKQMRIKIMQNIGVTFIQADREKMKKAFQKLITVPLEIDEDKYISPSDDPHTNLVTEAIKNDHLRQMERERCVEVVKASQYVELANDLEINKAVTYLRQKDYNQAVEILKVLEKKDSRVKSAAATNLSALYYMGKDFAQASSYADIAVNSDRYNPAALTNKGNTVFANGDYEKAAEFYKEALRNDSSCTEALYNIGLTYEKLNRLDEALDCFLKLHAILRNSAEVLYQIANIYELMENPSQAIEWLMQVVSVIPTDPQVLSKLGELYDREGDKSQAFQYYYESYRYFPCNIEVIEWLGAYYIDTQFWEKAIQYFERASLIQPTQVKWQLMVASCFRRSGNYQKALDTYKDTHRKFPENVECLRFLVRLCTDLGLKDAQEYARKLKRLEKMKEIREQRIKSGRDGSGGSRGKREGSASGDSGQNYSASSKGERLSARLRALPGTNEPYESSSNKEIDASYVDPLGPQIERPKTAAKKRIDEDDFADEELGDDLLPE
ncbi:intraflagellar transport protein 88 homolog isoform X14 [Homo sapiens]|uniref:intraflagellar transport protein 88 homolog isoform X14 n=2 Tax=Homo sapiens TaxID=9606 RepID=UPI0007DC58C7|nr:intraflagellar transport protein 88 homolog isoform X14 [Homo sapiens]XP_047286627.1 intraflagellar transport protein 88 homolog isoform X14 [Homo sapiens]|eukprot:XP_016876257.1 intraflagellar transport protein 88 homolog isoform X9 [Homo sapiens]